MKLEFDRVTSEPKADDARADFVVDGPSRLTRSQRFLNYAVILPAGEYVLRVITFGAVIVKAEKDSRLAGL